ncbi:hypothetical protein QBC38DRAFT_523928 [Podospora fimiseda]|uniref:Uncharacterized protein n=1 Tax=Podospora fimiseda TaxID=252190 RepID=A0AAN6YKM9_9PEZI|nr:hypothetical protein QBC38DRAFT_523928 [Podospora fimiseda]
MVWQWGSVASVPSTLPPEEVARETVRTERVRSARSTAFMMLSKGVWNLCASTPGKGTLETIILTGSRTEIGDAALGVLGPRLEPGSTDMGYVVGHTGPYTSRDHFVKVIDALDECITDLPQLLELITQTSSAPFRIKWIASSRNWTHIEEKLAIVTQNKLSLELNAKSVANAVDVYIYYKISQLSIKKKYNDKTKMAIQDYLLSNANGTFLWVALVCQALADPGLRNWNALRTLQTFPPGLDSLDILAVTATVRRPISLEEITSIAEMPDGLCDEPEALEEIINLCGSFLTLQDKTIYFVHQSAKDFLLGKASNNNRHFQEAFNWVFHLGKEEANYTIFSRSLEAVSTVLR